MTDQQIVMPVRPTWGSSVVQKYSFKTAVPGVARSGREQRRALRKYPRVNFDYDANGTREALRNAARFFTNRLDRIGLMLNPVEFTRLDVDFDVGTDTATMADIPYWMIAARFVILRAGDRYEAFEIDSVAGSDVTFTALAFYDWPAGTRVYKAEQARVDGASASFSMITRGTGTYGVAWDVDPAALLLPDATAAGATFDGRELFTDRPNLIEPIAVGISSGREDVDYGFGLSVAFSPVLFTTRDYKATYLGRDVDEVTYVVDFFRRMRGRWGEFYYPTGTADLKPIDDLATGAATLTVAGRLDYDYYQDANTANGNLVNKAVYVQLRDGTYLARKISSVTLSGSDSVFHMTANWGADVDLTSIAFVSYLPLCRFGTDELTIEWLTDSVAQFNLAIHTLESLPAE